jgi:hypothetical protein
VGRLDAALGFWHGNIQSGVQPPHSKKSGNHPVQMLYPLLLCVTRSFLLA